MDGLFFPLAESKYFVKLARTGSGEQNEASRVFLNSNVNKNGNSLNVMCDGKKLNWDTYDTLGSKDLLWLQWYMVEAGIDDNILPQSYKNKLKQEYKRLKTKDSWKCILEEGRITDLQTSSDCWIAYVRVLEIINVIWEKLYGKILKRLPPGGPGGLILLLCRSRNLLEQGCYRKWSNYVIHHFDPNNEENIDKGESKKKKTKDTNIPQIPKKSKPVKEKKEKIIESSQSINTISKKPKVVLPKKNSTVIVIDDDDDDDIELSKSMDTLSLKDKQPNQIFRVYAKSINNSTQQEIKDEFTEYKFKNINVQKRGKYGYFVTFKNQKDVTKALKLSFKKCKVSEYTPQNKPKK